MLICFPRVLVERNTTGRRVQEPRKQRISNFFSLSVQRDISQSVERRISRLWISFSSTFTGVRFSARTFLDARSTPVCSRNDYCLVTKRSHSFPFRFTSTQSHTSHCLYAFLFNEEQFNTLVNFNTRLQDF